MQNWRTVARSMRDKLNGVGLTPVGRSAGAWHVVSRDKIRKVFMYSISAFLSSFGRLDPYKCPRPSTKSGALSASRNNSFSAPVPVMWHKSRVKKLSWRNFSGVTTSALAIRSTGVQVMPSRHAERKGPEASFARSLCRGELPARCSQPASHGPHTSEWCSGWQRSYHSTEQTS